MSLLLDTNVRSEPKRERTNCASSHGVAQVNEDDVLVGAVTIRELLFGLARLAAGSVDSDEKLQ